MKEELVYKIKKDMEKLGSYSYYLNIDVDEIGDMFDMVWGELDGIINEEEKEQKPDPLPNLFNSEIKQYTLEQHTIPDDLKKKLKELGIKITRTPYGRLRFEADEFTIGLAESIHKLKFTEEVPKP